MPERQLAWLLSKEGQIPKPPGRPPERIQGARVARVCGSSIGGFTCAPLRSVSEGLIHGFEKRRSLRRSLENDHVLHFGPLHVAVCGVQRDRQHDWRILLQTL